MIAPRNGAAAPAPPPRWTFHELRHTAASLMLAQGIPLKVVQEILGHSQISLTADTYSHLLLEVQQDAAERLDGLLRRLDAPTTEENADGDADPTDGP
jgi:integrase